MSSAAVCCVTAKISRFWTVAKKTSVALSVQFAILKEVFEVQPYIVRAHVKQLRHFPLGKPDSLIPRPKLDLVASVFSSIANEFAHGIGSAGDGKSFCIKRPNLRTFKHLNLSTTRTPEEPEIDAIGLS